MVMMNRETERKRAELATYIRMEVIKEISIQGIVVIGSVAKEIARSDLLYLQGVEKGGTI